MAEEKDAVRRKVGRPRKYQTDAARLKAHRDSMMKTKEQVRVFLEPEDKEKLVGMCAEMGMTQGQVITLLIRNAIQN